MRPGFLTLVACAVLAVSRPAMAAEIVVIESTVVEIEAGSILDDAQTVSVPEGGMIVIVEEDGSSRTIEGPFEGTLASQGQSDDGGLVANLGKLVRNREESRQVLGAIRAAPGQVPAEVYMVDVARSGINCVLAGKPARLWRPETMSMETELSLESLNGSAVVQVLWANADQVLDWPKQVPASDGSKYRVRLAEASRSFDITIRQVPVEIEEITERIAWMAEAGCRRQARMALDQLSESR
jgi:hypothetical protein